MDEDIIPMEDALLDRTHVYLMQLTALIQLVADRAMNVDQNNQRRILNLLEECMQIVIYVKGIVNQMIHLKRTLCQDIGVGSVYEI